MTAWDRPLRLGFGSRRGGSIERPSGPARPVAVDVLKGVHMSFRASVVAGFRFDDAFAVQASSCNELDICFVARRKVRYSVQGKLAGVRSYLRTLVPGTMRSERP